MREIKFISDTGESGNENIKNKKGNDKRRRS